MSKITLEPNNSGTGTFTIAAPNSNTNRTFNLPDEAGTALTDATDLEPQVKDSLNATGSAPVYACRAWVNFGNTSGVTIYGSGNISSIIDVGDVYDISFSFSMPDDNYCVTGSSAKSGGPLSLSNSAFILGRERSNGNTPSQIVDFFVVDADANRTTSDNISVAVIR